MSLQHFRCDHCKNGCVTVPKGYWGNTRGFVALFLTGYQLWLNLCFPQEDFPGPLTRLTDSALCPLYFSCHSIHHQALWPLHSVSSLSTVFSPLCGQKVSALTTSTHAPSIPFTIIYPGPSSLGPQ